MLLRIHRVTVSVDGDNDPLPHHILGGVLRELYVEEAGVGSGESPVRVGDVEKLGFDHEADVVALELLGVDGESLLPPAEFDELEALGFSHLEKDIPKHFDLN